MKIIEAYLVKTVSTTLAFVLFALLSVSAMIALMNEVKEVGFGQYHFIDAVRYVLLNIPADLYNFFPICMLLSCIIGLGLLARHAELIALRASGVSVYQISWRLTKSLFLFIIFAVFIGEFIAPHASYLAEQQKAFLKNNGQTLLTQTKAVWLRDNSNFLYISYIENPTSLKGVSRYQLNNNNQLMTESYAKNLKYLNKKWVATDISTSFISDKHITTEKVQQEVWPLKLNPYIITLSNKKIEEFSLRQLYEYLHFSNLGQSNISQYAVAFWQHLFHPFTIIIMIWLSLPFVFGNMRSVQVGIRASIGILLGVAFYLLNEFFTSFAIVYQSPAWFTAFLPLLLFGLLSFWLMRSVH